MRQPRCPPSVATGASLLQGVTVVANNYDFPLGLKQEERMRLFLGCEKAPSGSLGYDMTKGKVRYQYTK